MKFIFIALSIHKSIICKYVNKGSFIDKVKRILLSNLRYFYNMAFGAFTMVLNIIFPINKIRRLIYLDVVVAQWVRAVAPQVEGWVFESQPRHT